MPKENIFIVAGNARQASEFKRKHNFENAKYLSSYINILGCRNGTVYLVGTWYERNDATDIHLYINQTCNSFKIIRESNMENGKQP